MSRSNDKKRAQLGMPIGTAQHRLRKKILFRHVQEAGKDTCFRCGEKMEDIDNFSIEHKVPWLDSDDPVRLFFDLENIAFSHLSCNSGAARYVGPAKQYVTLNCTYCGTEFERETEHVDDKLKMGQVDFYCCKSCAAKDGTKKGTSRRHSGNGKQSQPLTSRLL